MAFTISSLFLFLVLIYRFFCGSTRMHIDFFLFGVLYYFLVPGIVFEWVLVDSYPGVSAWFSVTSSFYQHHCSSFLALISGWCILFILGSYLVKRLNFRHNKLFCFRRIKNFSPDPFVGAIFIFILIGLLLYYLYRGWGILGHGYTAEYSSFLLGGIASISLLLYGLFLYFLWKQVTTLKIALLFFLCIAFAMLLLSGSRMYVLIPITGFFEIALLRNRTALKRWRLALAISGIGLLLVSVGVWRLGTFSFKSLLYILLAEPVFTSYSAATFWTQNNFNAFEVPLNALSGVLNLVPSTLWPDKIDSLFTIENMGYIYQSPLGATSVVVSLIGGFGMIGSFLFLFFVGAIFEFLYSQVNISSTRRAIYISLVSLLPFMFFRDAFHIFIKSAVTLVVLLPLALLLISAFLKGASTSSSAKRGTCFDPL